MTVLLAAAVPVDDEARLVLLEGESNWDRGTSNGLVPEIKHDDVRVADAELSPGLRGEGVDTEQFGAFVGGEGGGQVSNEVGRRSWEDDAGEPVSGKAREHAKVKG